MNYAMNERVCVYWRYHNLNVCCFFLSIICHWKHSHHESVAAVFVFFPFSTSSSSLYSSACVFFKAQKMCSAIGWRATRFRIDALNSHFHNCVFILFYSINFDESFNFKSILKEIGSWSSHRHSIWFWMRIVCTCTLSTYIVYIVDELEIRCRHKMVAFLVILSTMRSAVARSISTHMHQW